MKEAKYFWDLNPSALRETHKALRDSRHGRFPERLVTLLQRCDKPKELFSIVPKETFLEAWPKIRSYWLKRERHSVSRDWWETLYEQLVEAGHRKVQGKPSDLFRKVGSAMKEQRIKLGLSQKQL